MARKKKSRSYTTTGDFILFCWKQALRHVGTKSGTCLELLSKVIYLTSYLFPPPHVCPRHPRPPDLVTPVSIPGNTGNAGGLVTDQTALIWAPILGWGITNLLLHAWIGAAPFPDGEKGHRRAGPRGRSLQEMSQPPLRAGSAPRPPWILIPSSHVRAVTKPGLTAVTSSPLQPHPPEPETATAQRPQRGPPHIPPGEAQPTPPPLQPRRRQGAAGRAEPHRVLGDEGHAPCRAG